MLTYLIVFCLMQRMYTWRPELEAEVKKTYDEKAAIRLKDTAYKEAKKTDAPIWLGDDLLKAMKDKQKEKEAKKRSAQAKANRRGGNASDPAPPTNCQGSVSTHHRALQLVSLIFHLSIVKTHSLKSL